MTWASNTNVFYCNGIEVKISLSRSDPNAAGEGYVHHITSSSKNISIVATTLAIP
jgi:hypothetical protein